MAEIVTIKDILAPSFFRPYNDFITGRKSTLCFAGGRGCVDGDTLIRTPRGNVKIKDFDGGEVLVFDGNGVVNAYACASRRYTREKLYEVTLADGRSVTCTDEHRFLTKNGWSALKDISVGDCVLSTSVSRFQDLATLPLRDQTVSSCSLEKHCDGRRPMSSADVLRSMRRVLGCLCHYWQDFRLCDGLPPTEEDTYQDVLRRLVDAPEHNRNCWHEDDQDAEGSDSRSFLCERLPPMTDCLSHSLDRCCEDEEIRISRTLSESLSEIFPSMAQCLETGDLDGTVRRAARLLLDSILHLDSSDDGTVGHGPSFSKDSALEGDTLQKLSGMLLRRVHDESYSDSFRCPDEKSIDIQAAAFSTIKKIAFMKEDFYYDIFVPFYNNYITWNGIVNHNSTKSSCWSICVILGLERDRREALAAKAAGDPKWRSKLTHAICFRKVANTMSESVYTQLQWAVEKLRLTDRYVFLKTPLMIKRKGTDQRIMFRGLDDPQRIKSLKPPFGFFRYTVFEELAEYDGMEEILDAQRSVQRGGHDFVTFFSYNPPETSANWVNYRVAEIANEDPTFGFYKSDYRSVPREWLGDKFFRDAEILRRINERAYRHQYLGEVTGNGGTVFPNVRSRHVSDAEIATYDLIRWGCDFGLRDPTVLIPIYYNKVTHSITIFDEIYKPDMGIDDMERQFKEMHDVKYKSYEYIVADCAGATIIQTLRQRGIQMIPCTKGAGSIEAGIKFLQSLTSIDIDERRAPNAYKEFIAYEYEKNKSGDFTGRLPDFMNHAIDSCVTGETIVQTSSGPRRIDSLVGTNGKLLAFDRETGIVRSSDYCNCRQTRSNAQIISLKIEGGVEIKCTPDHRILTPDGYVPAGELNSGFVVMTWSGPRVVDNKTSCGVADVYDLEVPKYHNFIVNEGLVIHNCRYAIAKLSQSTSMFG